VERFTNRMFKYLVLALTLHLTGGVLMIVGSSLGLDNILSHMVVLMCNILGLLIAIYVLVRTIYELTMWKTSREGILRDKTRSL
jgi:hypothetical protein